ncbi:MAG: MFS transporter [Eubacterium sp.]|nr:MFS transporter [Eubacterium sp.]
MASENSGVKQKIGSLIDNVRYYWNDPPKGKYMNFKEIAAYAVGGIGSYFIISMGMALLVSTTNMIVGGAIGIAPMDMYVLYLISTLANIPLTAIRANKVDNTRGKGGKYRPYLISMGIPSAIIAIVYVWFPYNALYSIFTQPMLGKDGGYIAKCVVVLLLNLGLQYYFNFFNDAYTNLIHVLSPNTQERTDVLAIKSVVYSLAPSIMNIVLPIIAQVAANNNLYDIKVYRISYPIFAIIGMLLTVVVYANTKEKIVQAKTHTIQISFIDSFKAVAKNKYFWIIALAGWIGFLESAYGNILTWSFNYGHTCNGAQFAVIQTLIGNASLWGMLLAPICIRKWGKKNVLVGVNLGNVVCILAMIIDMRNIWWLFICVYFNWLVGAFEQITTPAIQADIRDYQQYRSGERIDGMFATVLTIGNLVTLLTSSVLPMVYEKYGVYEGNGYASSFDILDVNTGDPNLLYKLMTVLIIMAAVGAFLNTVPYFFYDFNEKKQKSVIRVLKVRSLFEDYGNNALDNHKIVEAIDLVEQSRKMAAETPKTVTKEMYKNISDKKQRKAAKKEYKEALNFNEEIEISKFVCAELDKFKSENYIYQVKVYSEILENGLAGIVNANEADLRREIAQAKAMPKNTQDEKEHRSFCIELAKKKLSAKKAFDKNYHSLDEFVEPDMAELTAIFDREDELDAQIFELNTKKTQLRKSGDNESGAKINSLLKNITAKRKELQKAEKAKMDEFAKFNRAAKPYIDARKLLLQQENYSHFEEIAALYDEAKEKADAEDKEKQIVADLKRREQQEELEARKAAKAARKANKKK